MCTALQDVSREILAVVAQVALGLGSHPDVRGLLKDLLGSTSTTVAVTGGTAPLQPGMSVCAPG